MMTGAGYWKVHTRYIEYHFILYRIATLRVTLLFFTKTRLNKNITNTGSPTAWLILLWQGTTGTRIVILLIGPFVN